MWTTRGRHAARARPRTRLTAAALALAGTGCLGVAAMPQPSSEPALSTFDSDVSAPARPTSPVADPGAAAAARVLPSSPPVSLAIPAIGVRTQLLRLGLTGSGALETPPPGPQYDQAGWYRYSPTPGSIGPAVVAGHVDSASGGPSVFSRLVDLRPQDRVLVTRADGTVAVFAVDEVRRYRKTAFPTALVYGDVDHAGLRLITCGGPFDRTSRHYLDNIIVLASLLPRPDDARRGT